MAKKKGAEARAERTVATSPADSPTDEGEMPQIPVIQLPIYEGSSDPWLWVRKCETFFSLYRVPVSQRVTFASLHLGGKAETWFHCMMQVKMKQQKGDICWEDFAWELCYRFGVAQHLNLLKEFNALNQCGSVQEYHGRFEEVLSLVMSMFPWYDSKQIVSRYIAGLKTAIMRQVKKHSPTTLARAFQLAKFYESPAGNKCYGADMEDDGEVVAVISPQAMNIKQRENMVHIQSLKPTNKMATWSAKGVTLPSKRPMTIMYDSWSSYSFIDPKLAEECGFPIRKSEQVHISTVSGKQGIVSDSVCCGFTWELNGLRSVHDMRVLKLNGGLDMILGTDIHRIFSTIQCGSDENGDYCLTFSRS